MPLLFKFYQLVHVQIHLNIFCNFKMCFILLLYIHVSTLCGNVLDCEGFPLVCLTEADDNVFTAEEKAAQ